jgi:NADPH:quinone reductase-like Zn-dependent oxidoreductase
MPDTPLQFIGTGFRFISWERAHPEVMRLVYERLVAAGVSRFVVLDPTHDMDAVRATARMIRQVSGSGGTKIRSSGGPRCWGSCRCRFGHRGGAQAEYVVVAADALARVPEGIGLEAAATLPMNALTARAALDELGLRPGQTLAVTGAAGAVGGDAIQLGRAEGLRVIADAAPADEALVRGLGADVVVPRGPDVAVAVRKVVPGGVDALLDAAVLGPPVLGAVRDGGQLMAVRPFSGDSERDIKVSLVLVFHHLHQGETLAQLAELAAKGVLTPRVADVLPASEAAAAHRRFEAGGVRGRLVLTF